MILCDIVDLKVMMNSLFGWLACPLAAGRMEMKSEYSHWLVASIVLGKGEWQGRQGHNTRTSTSQRLRSHPKQPMQAMQADSTHANLAKPALSTHT